MLAARARRLLADPVGRDVEELERGVLLERGADGLGAALAHAVPRQVETHERRRRAQALRHRERASHAKSVPRNID
eukprot:3666950-Pleurochrysis_carterae.AAC.1